MDLIEDRRNELNGGQLSAGKILTRLADGQLSRLHGLISQAGGGGHIAAKSRGPLSTSASLRDTSSINDVSRTSHSRSAGCMSLVDEPSCRSTKSAALIAAAIGTVGGRRSLPGLRTESSWHTGWPRLRIPDVRLTRADEEAPSGP